MRSLSKLIAFNRIRKKLRLALHLNRAPPYHPPLNLSHSIATRKKEKPMSIIEPFQITPETVRRAGLERADVHQWCLVVDGCYHLFDTETAARRAYAMLPEGEFVR